MKDYVNEVNKSKKYIYKNLNKKKFIYLGNFQILFNKI